MVNKGSLLYYLYINPIGYSYIGVRIVGLHNCDVLTKVIDFVHVLMYIKIRKKDNVKEGVPLPITKVEH